MLSSGDGNDDVVHDTMFEGAGTSPFASKEGHSFP
jgi:hypothetical protein